MATAILRNDAAPTINASFTRDGGELRVSFSSDIGKGFSIDELDILQAAIDHARRQMLDDDAPVLTVVRSDADTEDNMQARYQTQLRRQVPVPT